MGIALAVAGLALLLWVNKDKLPNLKKAVESVDLDLTPTVERTSPDIHDAVDAVRVLQQYFPKETAEAISKAAGSQLFTVGGKNVEAPSN